jgi:4-amino-4-deoxy-L-arabinose transferase-like glycosyltransferase
MNKKVDTSLALLFLIVLVAMMVRATFNRMDYMMEGVPAQYGYENGRIATAIVTGHGFSNPYPNAVTGATAQQPPVYIYLLAGIYKMFGVQSATSYLVASTLNGLFSALVCIPIFFLGRRVAGDALGLVAAALWAVMPSAVVLTTGPISGAWETALSALLAALILLATLRVRDSDRTAAWAGYGLLVAFSLEVNPTFLAVLPLLFVWLGWQLYQHRRAWLRLPALAGLVIVLGCAPWAVRNWVTFHQFIPFRSNFGLELWLGNNQYEDHDLFPDWRTPYTSGLERQHLAKVGEIAFMREKQTEAIQYMATHRWQTLRSIYLRYVETWTGVAVRFQDIWPGMAWPDRVTLVTNALLGICGWLGLWAMFRERNELAWPFFAYLVFYPAVYYITHATLRYRHPIDPALTVLSTFAVFCAARAVSRRFLGVSPPSSSAAEALPSPAAD